MHLISKKGKIRFAKIALNQVIPFFAREKRGPTFRHDCKCMYFMNNDKKRLILFCKLEITKQCIVQKQYHVQFVKEKFLFYHCGGQ